MPAIKSASEIASKWSRVTPQRSQDYQEGVSNPKKDWATETAAAEATYVSGVTEAAGQGRFGKGVREAGTEKWKKNALEKGVSRWPAGVAQGADEYQKNFAPYVDVISRTSLPKRGPRGSAQNYARSREMGQALHEAKTGRA